MPSSDPNNATVGLEQGSLVHARLEGMARTKTPRPLRARPMPRPSPRSTFIVYFFPIVELHQGGDTERDDSVVLALKGDRGDATATGGVPSTPRTEYRCSSCLVRGEMCLWLSAKLMLSDAGALGDAKDSDVVGKLTTGLTPRSPLLCARQP